MPAPWRDEDPLVEYNPHNWPVEQFDMKVPRNLPLLMQFTVRLYLIPK